MRVARIVGVLGLVFCALASNAAPEKWTFTYGARPVGAGDCDIQADGSFTSHTLAQIATTKIETTLSGKWVGAKIDSVEIDAHNGARASKVSFKNELMDVIVDGKAVTTGMAFEPKSDIAVSFLNPGLCNVTAAKLLQVKSGTSVDMFIIDNFVDLKCLVKKTTSILSEGSTVKALDIVTINVSGLDIMFAFDGGKVVGMDVPAQKFGAYVEGYANAFVDPATKFKELSQPTLKTITDAKVISPMADGTPLACTVVRPNDALKHPVVLIRTPYGRDMEAAHGDWWASRGYVLVCQDVRGRGASSGDWDPFNREVADGKATLDWLVKQPWCDGKVGMIGGSYLGFVQWAAAVTHHPALKAIIPQVSPPDPTRNMPWDHGAFMLAPGLWWSRIVKEKDADLGIAFTQMTNGKAFFELPVSRVDDVFFKQNIPFFDLWLNRPSIDQWRGSFRDEQIRSVTIPTLHVSGIWDGDGIGTKTHWQDGRLAGRKNQWMIFGPWEHGFNVKSKFGDQDYGPQSLLELDSVYLRFFDTFLKGKSVQWEAQPHAKVFVTGSNQWISSADYPFTQAKLLKLYLSGGVANGPKTRGLLSAKASGRDDVYTYDPNKPRYKGGSLTPGAVESTFQDAKSFDAASLAYNSAPFGEDTIVTGPITAELYVSTTAKDATFHVMVLDQYPDGRVQGIGLPGSKRVWFEVYQRPKAIVPGKVYKIKVEPWEFAHLFKKGHKLTLAITSDLFPQFARNPGTGESEATAKKLVAAKHTIHRSAKYPSALTFYTVKP